MIAFRSAPAPKPEPPDGECRGNCGAEYANFGCPRCRLIRERDAAETRAAEVREQHEKIMTALKTTGLPIRHRDEVRDEEWREWEQRIGPTVECPACGFAFSADHDEKDGRYSCPNCEQERAEARVAELETDVTTWRNVAAAREAVIGRAEARAAELEAELDTLRYVVAEYAGGAQVNGELRAVAEARVEELEARIAELEAGGDRSAVTRADGVGFRLLSIVNSERANRWHPGFPEDDDWNLADWSNAMCGEAGEAANVVKKLRRHETGHHGALDGDEATLRAALAHELADVILYVDLLATKAEIDLCAAVVEKFNIVSERQGFPDRLPTDDCEQRRRDIPTDGFRGYMS